MEIRFLCEANEGKELPKASRDHYAIADNAWDSINAKHRDGTLCTECTHPTQGDVVHFFYNFIDLSNRYNPWRKTLEMARQYQCSPHALCWAIEKTDRGTNRETIASYVGAHDYLQHMGVNGAVVWGVVGSSLLKSFLMDHGPQDGQGGTAAFPWFHDK